MSQEIFAIKTIIDYPLLFLTGVEWPEGKKTVAIRKTTPYSWHWLLGRYSEQIALKYSQAILIVSMARKQEIVPFDN